MAKQPPQVPTGNGDRNNADDLPRVAAGDFETAVLNAYDAIMIAHYGEDGWPIVDFINPAFTAMTQFEPAEILGKSIRQLYGPKTDPRFTEERNHALGQGERRRFETVNYRKDGSEFWVEVTSAPIADEGEHRRFISVRRDNTARHFLEEHLARAQRIARVGSFDRNLRTGAATWSAELYRLFGRNAAGPAPTWSEMLEQVVETDRQRMRKYFDELSRGVGPPSVEFSIVRPDGEVRMVVGEADCVDDQIGCPVRVVGIARDVTEQRAVERRQKELELQLLHAQRLDALGTLAGGIAHEFNNALVPILALSKITMEDLPAESAERNNLEIVVEASLRARDLVQQILDFSRKGAPKLQYTDLGGLVGKTLRMLRVSVPPTIAIEVSIAPVPAILGDPRKLEQVVVNLVTNAMQAIGHGPGTISVDVGTASPAATEIRLVVCDTGPGMDEMTRQRAFEPFFTTKAVGEGAGLGLAVVYGIVAEHAGRIEIDSQPGEGACLRVFLPVPPTEAKAAPGDHDATAPHMTAPVTGAAGIG